MCKCEWMGIDAPEHESSGKVFILMCFLFFLEEPRQPNIPTRSPELALNPFKSVFFFETRCQGFAYKICEERIIIREKSKRCGSGITGRVLGFFPYVGYIVFVLAAENQRARPSCSPERFSLCQTVHELLPGSWATFVHGPSLLPSNLSALKLDWWAASIVVLVACKRKAQARCSSRKPKEEHVGGIHAETLLKSRLLVTSHTARVASRDETIPSGSVAFIQAACGCYRHRML
jgi:hypothetical protein